MSEITGFEPIVMDVRSMPKSQHRALIFEALECLEAGCSVVVQSEYNPISVRRQVEAIYGEQFTWHYLEEGPEVFRLQFTRQTLVPGDCRPCNGDMTPVVKSSPEAPALLVDLVERSRVASHSGPQWAHECEDLDLTLLTWENGKCIESHMNHEVDVVLTGIAGNGIVAINGQAYEMRPGLVLLIPKGCERAIQSTSECFSYLSVHRRRRGLMPTLNGKPLS